MISEHARQWPWRENGARITARAYAPGNFIHRYLSPLLFWRTSAHLPPRGWKRGLIRSDILLFWRAFADSSLRESKEITSEEVFWRKAGNLILETVRLAGFRLTDWFPHAPGVYWSRDAQRFRKVAYSGVFTNPQLGNYVVMSLKADLAKLKESHGDEVKEIADALEKAVANAAKPPQERKKNLLQLSAKGLKEAAELVKDTAPSILTAADQIAKFIAGL